jgi:hypothetical protein
MSDTKWRKLLRALIGANFGFVQMRVKFIDVDEPHVMQFPGTGALNCPIEYLDTLEFGPVELRAIEWLELPATAFIQRPNKVPPKEVAQKVDEAAAIVAALGRFPLEKSPQGVRITGYTR